MIHGLVTLAWCVLCAVLRLPWPFFFWPVALYLGREHAQAEERWMRARDLNREKSPWWMGYAPSAWTLKSLSDVICPLVAALSFAIAREMVHG